MGQPQESMLRIESQLSNHFYREISVSPADLFPQWKEMQVLHEFLSLKDRNPHQTILNIAAALANGGYDLFLQQNGFWDSNFAKYSGHCHQCSPILGLILKALGFRNVAYLECYRIREHFPQTGIIEKVPPEEEPNPDNKEEFCSIQRIPYCCTEVEINGEKFYISGKHVKVENGRLIAWLTPACYRPMVGVFSHQKNPTKSGIYLENVTPQQNPEGIDFNTRIVWMKQTPKDPSPELFATYLRMRL